MQEKLTQEKRLDFEIHGFEKIFLRFLLKKNSDFCFKVLKSRYNKKRAFLFCVFMKGLLIFCKKDFVFHLDLIFFFFGMCLLIERYNTFVLTSEVRISQVKSLIF
jgi:hypothetical protein